MASYKPERAEWAIEVQEKCAIPIYKRKWPGCSVIEIDKLGMNGDNTARQFDFSGLDKIIMINRNMIHLAQRFRKPNPRGNDFSLRFKTPAPNGVSQEAEYFILTNAFKQGIYYPDKYAFGITNNDQSSSGFKTFIIYNLKQLLEAITQGRINPIGIFDNRDGSSGIYFSIAGLQKYEEYRLLSNGQTALSFF